ncbi:hypothetical protein [Spartinivicinus ruber]|uniref:hypothetical protein n=1 Tax=Spartinivicinus ruber TaxID=2683272 RepID=UPI0013D5DFC4|nr:hypothetical protein [Spartinivicinus ruber]
MEKTSLAKNVISVAAVFFVAIFLIGLLKNKPNNKPQENNNQQAQSIENNQIKSVKYPANLVALVIKELGNEIEGELSIAEKNNTTLRMRLTYPDTDIKSEIVVATDTAKVLQKTIQVLMQNGINPNFKKDDISIMVWGRSPVPDSPTGEKRVRSYGRSYYNPYEDKIVWRPYT